MISANLSAVFYLISGILFILALRGLSSPDTSRQGNYFGIAGMTIAIFVTFLSIGNVSSSLVYVIISEYCLSQHRLCKPGVKTSRFNEKSDKLSHGSSGNSVYSVLNSSPLEIQIQWNTDYPTFQGTGRKMSVDPYCR